jgi:DNA polymerase III delta subunit
MSVMVLHGNSKSYIQIRSQEILEEYRANGYEVRELSPKSELSLEECFSSGLFDTSPVLVFVKNPMKVKGLSAYLKDTRGCEVLVSYDKDKLPKMLTGYMSQCFTEPKYDNQKLDWCAKFVSDYVERHGKKISNDLSKAVVSKVGTDLGVLRFEVLKYVMSSEGEDITPRTIAGNLGDLTGPESSDLIDSIISRDSRRFLKVCAKIEKSSSTDQTMAVCNGLLFYTLRQLFDVGVLLAEKYTPDQIANDLGKNPWLVQNILKPQVESLGLERIILLIESLYNSENSVLKGSRNPWSKFKSEILRNI